MFQDYVNKSTKKVLGVLETAIAELAALKQNVLTPDFILLALVSQPDNEALQIIEHLAPDPKVTVARIKEQVRAHYQGAVPVQATQIVGSKELEDVFGIAYDEAKKLGDEYIATGTLFIALFDEKAGHTKEFLRKAGLSRNAAFQALKELRGGRTIGSEDAESEEDILARYTRDLTELARAGELDPVIGRESEIAQIVQIVQTLSRRARSFAKVG